MANQRMFARFLRVLTGILLIPACVAITLTLLDMQRGMSASHLLFTPVTRWLCYGFFSWLLIWFLTPQPIQAYIMAHELTHAFWGLLFGARISELRVSKHGGSVRVSRSNLLITLAPYFFPFYTVLVLLARWIVSSLIHPLPYPLLWVFLVGFTWSFHLCFTIQSLMIKQPDIQEHGRLFSWTIVYLFNLLGVGLWMVCATEATLAGLSGAFTANLMLCYGNVMTTLGAALRGYAR